jgi:RNA polymerase sigma-70 factor (ECF subfamily)
MAAMTAAEREGLAASLLVARAKAGDAEAFAELVRRYRKRIFALALHLTKSSSEADDIAQEVFLKAYRALDQFEGRSEFFTWVYRMAVNRSLNARRDRERRGETDMDDPRLELAVAADAKGDPRRAAELRQTYAQLLACARRPAGRHAHHRGAGRAAGQCRTPRPAWCRRSARARFAWRMHEARRRLAAALAATRRGKARPLSLELSRALVEHGLPVLAIKPTDRVGGRRGPHVGRRRVCLAPMSDPKPPAPPARRSTSAGCSWLT